MSQAELARQASVRAATISAMETGTSRGVDFDVLERLARALGVDAALLIVSESEAPPKRGKGK
jgi:transcriptional regulator with XRE-family HTH domain